jgi:hypothetical protein
MSSGWQERNVRDPETGVYYDTDYEAPAADMHTFLESWDSTEWLVESAWAEDRFDAVVEKWGPILAGRARKGEVWRVTLLGDGDLYRLTYLAMTKRWLKNANRSGGVLA